MNAKRDLVAIWDLHLVVVAVVVCVCIAAVLVCLPSLVLLILPKLTRHSNPYLRQSAKLKEILVFSTQTQGTSECFYKAHEVDLIECIFYR